MWKYATTPPYVFMAWCLIRYGIHLDGVVLSEVQEQLYLKLHIKHAHLDRRGAPPPPQYERLIKIGSVYLISLNNLHWSYFKGTKLKTKFMRQS
jgi:hypothetical protein